MIQSTYRDNQHQANVEKSQTNKRAFLEINSLKIKDFKTNFN